MITIARSQARELRGLFRRSTLGLPTRGPAPPLVFEAEGEVDGHRVRLTAGGLTVIHTLKGGASGVAESIALPLDALAEFEGRDGGTVTLEAVTPGRVVARWYDRGVPRVREYDVPPAKALPPAPALPDAWSDVTSGLLDALAEASATADADSARYALGCVQVREADGAHEVIATDGRQLLVQGGFKLPWAGEHLIRRSPAFAARALSRALPLKAGRTSAHLALRCGDWTLLLEPVKDARYPDVSGVLPGQNVAETRLRLDPAVAALLADGLGRLPGAADGHAPVTLDLNGRVAVRAREADGGPVTELVLSRSSYTGPPVRLSADRHILARALRLGFTSVELCGPSNPAACRDGARALVWQPLSADSAVAPADDALVVDSASVMIPPEKPPTRSVPMPERPQQSPSPKPEAVDVQAPADATAGLATLIAEAESLHAELTAARARAARLSSGLRRLRKRDRLVATTLASLRGLRLAEAAG